MSTLGRRWSRPRLRLGRESIALSASVLRQLSLAAMALLAGLRLYSPTGLVPVYSHTPHLSDIVRTAIELVLLIVIFDRLFAAASLHAHARALDLADTVFAGKRCSI